MITKSFSNTFHYILLAKARRFIRRSIFQYFFAVVLFSSARYLMNPTLEPVNIILEGVIGFIFLCIIVILILIIAAKVQAQKKNPFAVTFLEDKLIIMSSDKTATHSWDWILSAEESQVYISLLIRKRPFYELYLSKSKLNEVEYQTLRDWLIRHDKLV